MIVEAETKRDELSGLIDRYCAVWNETSSGRRAELLEQVWAEGATYTDPTINATTSHDLLAHIERVQSRRPGSKVVRTSPVDGHHRIARFSWCVVQPDGTALPDGLDIAELSADGTRLTRIVGFFGSLPKL